MTRIKNYMFWLGIIGVIFSAAGIDFNTLTNWKLLLEAILSILNNPVAIVSVLMALGGVWVNPTTPGLLDKGECENE